MSCVSRPSLLFIVFPSVVCLGYLGDSMGWISFLLLFRGVCGFSAADTVMQGPTSVVTSWSVSSYKHMHSSEDKLLVFKGEFKLFFPFLSHHDTFYLFFCSPMQHRWAISSLLLPPEGFEPITSYIKALNRRPGWSLDNKCLCTSTF